ncbi:hypothetical protein NLU13_8637 [Sarocladium strictum]|uniref:Uncharacterized protein n=1 Tax=Sarocladium strictum TaxID=5046 RepID=A0AA39GCL2_SARSR|nr:hypothetical protein NLU13_8637 [Sarocladium strictum]
MDCARSPRESSSCPEGYHTSLHLTYNVPATDSDIEPHEINLSSKSLAKRAEFLFFWSWIAVPFPVPCWWRQSPLRRTGRGCAVDRSGASCRRDSTFERIVCGRRKAAAAANAPTSRATSSSTPSTVQQQALSSSQANHLVIPDYITANGQRVAATLLSPMSLDHLIPLIQYNVFRATVTNIHLTRLHHLLDNRCTHAYNNYTSSSRSTLTIPVFPAPLPLFPRPEGLDDDSSVPSSLQPTPLQRTTPHHPPWISVLPCGRMRDNAVRNLHRLDVREFCADLLPHLVGEGDRASAGGLVVWTTPWEASGWEVEPGFVRKWGFLIQGCVELMHATNRYRCLRGEEPLEW